MVFASSRLMPKALERCTRSLPASMVSSKQQRNGQAQDTRSTCQVREVDLASLGGTVGKRLLHRHADDGVGARRHAVHVGAGGGSTRLAEADEFEGIGQGGQLQLLQPLSDNAVVCRLPQLQPRAFFLLVVFAVLVVDGGGGAAAFGSEQILHVFHVNLAAASHARCAAWAAAAACLEKGQLHGVARTLRPKETQ